jgi:hypothetical protein
MADDMSNTTPEVGRSDETFEVFLPVTDSMDEDGTTHVATMRGDEVAFVDVLAEFVRTGSPASAPLREPVAATSLDDVRFALNGLGPAEVVSIEARDAGGRDD